MSSVIPPAGIPAFTNGEPICGRRLVVLLNIGSTEMLVASAPVSVVHAANVAKVVPVPWLRLPTFANKAEVPEVSRSFFIEVRFR